MLGRTHMGLGAIGAVAATPVVLHSTWEPMRQILNGNWAAIPHLLLGQVILVVATVIGSVLPDLDQPDSVAAHKVESFAALPIFAICVLSIFVLHYATSLTAWAIAILVGFVFSKAKNFSRRIGLGVVAAGLLYLVWHKDLPWIASVLLAVWCVGAMFTAHRTFTHSLLGLFLFGIGVYQSMSGLERIHLGAAAVGLIVGYVLHLAADAVAGGIPLLWPWGKRQGIRLVQTGGPVDHLIGGLAMVGFALLLMV